MVRMRARVIGPGTHGSLRVAVQRPDGGEHELSAAVERIPEHLRMPNCQFVAVLHSGELKNVDSAGEAWLEVQNQIRAVLNEDWDPIGVADSVADEYDSYIADLYAMLKRGESRASIANHLLTLESQMGVGVDRIDYLRGVAEKLRLLKLPVITYKSEGGQGS